MSKFLEDEFFGYCRSGFCKKSTTNNDKRELHFYVREQDSRTEWDSQKAFSPSVADAAHFRFGTTSCVSILNTSNCVVIRFCSKLLNGWKRIVFCGTGKTIFAKGFGLNNSPSWKKLLFRFAQCQSLTFTFVLVDMWVEWFWHGRFFLFSYGGNFLCFTTWYFLSSDPLS